MKYCPHCQQWNHGRPMRCRYCGRTWNVKLCPAGHLNPVNANFCGECGRSNLSEPAGRLPLIFRIIKVSKYVLYAFLIFLCVMVVIELLMMKPTDTQISLLIAIVILVIGVNFVLKKSNLSLTISGRSIYRAVVRFYEWVSSLRIR